MQTPKFQIFPSNAAPAKCRPGRPPYFAPSPSRRHWYVRAFTFVLSRDPAKWYWQF